MRRAPEGVEVAALERLDADLAALPADASAEDIQNIVYEIGKTRRLRGAARLVQGAVRDVARVSQGPRMGSFIALYGVANTRKLIAEALAR